jgi:hypothetical protein
MNIEAIRQMTEKRAVFKVENHSHMIASPIKAMMI